MDIKRELEELEEEIRAMMPNIAATKPDLIPKLAAITLAGNYHRKGLPACVPCPVCGDILKVSKVEFGEGRGDIWTGCSKGCTSERMRYG